MFIDFHTHCFPPRLAPRAIEKLSYNSGGLIPQHDGTPEGLIRVMDREGVDISVVLNIATNPHQMHAVNDFAISTVSDRLIPFGTVHPDAPDALDELDRIAAAGLRGIKLHPDYQGFFVNDAKMKPIYEKISRLGLVTVFHAGSDYGFRPPFGCEPKALSEALGWFSSPVIAAHWGGQNMGADVIRYLCGLPLWFDVSMGYSAMPRYIALDILERHGAEKIVFGTDMPWQTPAMAMRLLNTLGLSDNERELILHGNAERLLGLRQKVLD